MKLEIELDLNKIDYDAINKQIAEKVAELDLKDMYDVELKIDNKITSIINKAVDDSYNSYLDRYWSGTTSEGRNLIQSMTKTEIENHTKNVLEDIFANDYNEDTMREVMLKMLPDVFASILFRRMESVLFDKEWDYYNYMQNMVRNEIDNAIGRTRY